MRTIVKQQDHVKNRIHDYWRAWNLLAQKCIKVITSITACTCSGPKKGQKGGTCFLQAADLPVLRSRVVAATSLAFFHVN